MTAYRSSPVSFSSQQCWPTCVRCSVGASASSSTSLILLSLRGTCCLGPLLHVGERSASFRCASSPKVSVQVSLPVKRDSPDLVRKPSYLMLVEEIRRLSREGIISVAMERTSERKQTSCYAYGGLHDISLRGTLKPTKLQLAGQCNQRLHTLVLRRHRVDMQVTVASSGKSPLEVLREAVEAEGRAVRASWCTADGKVISEATTLGDVAAAPLADTRAEVALVMPIGESSEASGMPNSNVLTPVCMHMLRLMVCA
jgi:hypothetical protein